MSPLSVMDYKHTPVDREGARLDIFISVPAQHQLKCSWGAQSMILHTQDTIFSCSRHAASQRDNFLSILAECRLVVSSVAPGPVTQHSSHQPSTQPPPAGTGWIDNIFHPLACSESYTVYSCELCIGGRLSSPGPISISLEILTMYWNCLKASVRGEKYLGQAPTPWISTPELYSCPSWSTSHLPLEVQTKAIRRYIITEKPNFMLRDCGVNTRLA